MPNGEEREEGFYHQSSASNKANGLPIPSSFFLPSPSLSSLQSLSDSSMIPSLRRPQQSCDDITIPGPLLDPLLLSVMILSYNLAPPLSLFPVTLPLTLLVFPILCDYWDK